MKKQTKGKDPRSINLPKFGEAEIISPVADLTHAAKLDSIWDGESIDEDKEREIDNF